MGAAGHWLHCSTLPCLVWAFSLRYAEPDAILHECTPQFQQDKLRAILNGARARSPRHPLGRSLSPARYSMRSSLVNPTDLGIPTRRHRRYTTFVLDGCVQFCST
eukprot:9062383-Alexandrium_andersonii.AAC.1